ncbi:hypothetical protein [Parashewanella tropica]|uniref:hypothetical protein n=1 Tax=Parashewanella tropica TaxID=2547970 RepID=UPI00105A4194|nr:hypothetical protein [Parashewanella tropica]
MKNTIINLLLIFVACSFTAQAQAVGTTKTQSQKIKAVISTGEQVLGEKHTLEEAYVIAEKVAKAKVVKKMGEYFETVSITNSKTNSLKQYHASISASVLKYEVISKKKILVDDELVVQVTIKAFPEPAKLKSAMKRFQNNERTKNELKRINAQFKRLSAKLKERDDLVAKLTKLQNDKASEIHKANTKVRSRDREINRLKIKLSEKRKQIASSASLFDDKVMVFAKTHFTNSGSERMSKLEKRKQEALRMEPAYIETLKSIISKFEHDIYVWVTEDVTEETITVSISPYWKVPENMAQMPFNGGKIDEKFRNRYKWRSTHVKINSKWLGSKAQDLLHLKYAIFYVVNVNDEKIEIPVLLPVEHHEDLAYNEQCSYADNLGSRKKWKFLCFNYSFNSSAIEDRSAIAFDEYLNKSSFKLEFPIDEDVDVKSRFEIREVKSGKKVFTKTNG